MTIPTMMRLMLAAAVLPWASPILAKPVPDAITIVAPNARVETLWEGGTWLEGPAVTPTGVVYFSDLIQNSNPGKLSVIHVYDPRTRTARLFRSPSGESNGMVLDPRGQLLAAHGASFGGRYITRTDLATNRSTIVAGLYKGHPFNSPNDLTVDRTGRIYFTDPRYHGHEAVEQPAMGVYRVDLDGSVHLLVSDLVRPNGITISPDDKRLYVCESDGTPVEASANGPAWSGKVRIFRYDLTGDGSVSNKTLVADYTGKNTPVDGMKTDRNGNLYVTEMSDKPGIRVLAPSGKTIAFIPTVEKPINLTLSTVEGVNWLYFTTATRLSRIRINTTAS